MFKYALLGASLIGDAWAAYTCTCSNGTAATGSECTSDGAKCASCNTGYYANGDVCTAWTVCSDSQYESTSPTTTQNRVCSTKVCACSNGTAAMGAACPSHDGAKCASCDAGIADGWVQSGADIDGEAARDWSGFSVSLSGNGTVMAIGGGHNDGNGTDSGHVRVYENIGDVWTQVGGDIDGEAANDTSGWSVSLSGDGSVVAIGAHGNDGNGFNSGHVRVYENIEDVWTQVGEDIDGEAADDSSGHSVSLSGDGSVVAIGAWNNRGNGHNSGHVRVYENIEDVWTQVGEDIDGETAGDLSGYSVSMSADGSVVAIGGYNNIDNGYNSGHVRVYENIEDVWTQVGEDIDGETAGDESGYSVSLSADGSVVAIGARWNNGNGFNSGHVRVYENIEDVWTQVGEDIDGEAAHDWSGNSVSLSGDGSVVAIGAWNNRGNGHNSGHVRVYENIEDVWTQVSEDIDGETAGDLSGYSVSMSADGSVVAIGGYNNDGNGTDSGHARVYSLTYDAGYYANGDVCTAWTVCSDSQYESTSPTTTQNRVCSTKVCACSDGTAAMGAACPAHDGAKCASCDAGYGLSGTTCAAYTCTCSNGSPATGSECTSDGAKCASCDAGYGLSGTTCAAYTCTCSNGSPATGSECTSDGAKCASCNTGYFLSGTTCAAYTCTCSNGSPETGSACTSDGAKCASCNAGYHLSGGACAAYTCTCSNGSPATGSECTSDGAKCASCDAGYYANGDVCTAWTVCSNSQYESTPPNTTQNRVCSTKVCVCSGGTGATGTACPTHGTAKCACVGLLDGGCTSEQKTEAFLSRTDGETNCTGVTPDPDRDIAHNEANTAGCKTLGCTTQEIEDSFTCR